MVKTMYFGIDFVRTDLFGIDLFTKNYLGIDCWLIVKFVFAMNPGSFVMGIIMLVSTMTNFEFNS